MYRVFTSHCSPLALATALSLAGATGALAETESGSAVKQALNGDAPTMTTWEVDMRGRPPYRRERVEVPVLDVAALETAQDEADVETVTVWEVDSSGKPPYRRRQVEVPVVDAAAMETIEAGESDRPQFRGRPPFKRHH